MSATSSWELPDEAAAEDTRLPVTRAWITQACPGESAISGSAEAGHGDRWAPLDFGETQSLRRPHPHLHGRAVELGAEPSPCRTAPSRGERALRADDDSACLGLELHDVERVVVGAGALAEGEAAALANDPGDIVDRAGKVVGRHDGIVRFTVGQRRGLALGERTGTDNDPLYVVKLEPETRRVVVGPKSALGRREIALYDINWLGPEFDGALPVQVRVRSSQALRLAEVERAPGALVVRFAEPEIGVSPGQACVIHDRVTGSRVLGGGFIRRFP